MIALAGSLAIVGLVVAGSIDGGGESGGGDDSGDSEAQTVGCVPEAEGAVDSGFYVVEEGDILSSIALRTCVPETELTELNPDVDPQTLSPGQCLSLVKRGCEQREQ